MKRFNLNYKLPHSSKSRKRPQDMPKFSSNEYKASKKSAREYFVVD